MKRTEHRFRVDSLMTHESEATIDVLINDRFAEEGTWEDSWTLLFSTHDDADRFYQDAAIRGWTTEVGVPGDPEELVTPVAQAYNGRWE